MKKKKNKRKKKNDEHNFKHITQNNNINTVNPPIMRYSQRAVPYNAKLKLQQLSYNVVLAEYSFHIMGS